MIVGLCFVRNKRLAKQLSTKFETALTKFTEINQDIERRDQQIVSVMAQSQTRGIE